MMCWWFKGALKLQKKVLKRCLRMFDYETVLLISAVCLAGMKWLGVLRQRCIKKKVRQIHKYVTLFMRSFFLFLLYITVAPKQFNFFLFFFFYALHIQWIGKTKPPFSTVLTYLSKLYIFKCIVDILSLLLILFFIGLTFSFSTL